MHGPRYKILIEVTEIIGNQTESKMLQQKNCRPGLSAETNGTTRNVNLFVFDSRMLLLASAINSHFSGKLLIIFYALVGIDFMQMALFDAV